MKQLRSSVRTSHGREAYTAILPVALVLIVVFTSIGSRHAQADNHDHPPYASWDSPTMLFQTAGRASEAEVVADPFGGTHVFWAYGAPNAEEEGGGQAIYYTHQQEGTWLEPVDVLISPGGRTARMPSIAADGRGYIHIIWSAGNALFYSFAFASEAGAAGGWAAPKVLASDAALLEPTIAIAPNDALLAVWSQGRSGLMFSRSDNSGDSWSTPQVIYQAENDNELARWGRIAVDEAGRLHVVLTYTVTDPQARYGRTDAMLLYYLRSIDQGVTWSAPLLITPEPDFGEVNVATFGQDTVHLVWNGRAGRHGRYHRWSQDGGETWSTVGEIIAPAPASPVGDGGLTGFPALAVDTTGALHMVTTAELGNFYLRWQDGVWSSPVLISPGLDGGGVTGQNRSLEQPSVAISQGNQLQAVFHDGFERIWYTRVDIDAPYAASSVLPIADDVPTIAPPAELADLTGGRLQATPAPAVQLLTTAPQSGWSTAPLLVSLASVILLIGIVLLAAGSRNRR